MPESLLPVNLFAAAIAALLLGYLAQRVHLPPLAGYLLAGFALGPYTPGFTSDLELTRSLAEIGVAFLMFAVGLQIHIDALRRVGKIGVLGGTAQVALTIGIGAAIARVIGATWTSAFFFGAVVSISSTVVAVKLLTDRDQLVTLHGRIALSILLVQDLLVIPLVLVLPVLGGPTPSLVDVFIGLGKAAAIFMGSALLGVWVIPRLLDRVIRSGSQELTTLAVISLALGGAIATEAAGVSAAVGAFLAGLIVRHVRPGYDVLRSFTPLLGLFGIFFFISIGMLFDPRFIVREPAAAAVTILLVIAGKFAVVALVTRLFGYGRRVSVLVGLYLAQAGELSFVLAGLGLGKGVMTQEEYNLVLVAALVSIFLSPFFVQASVPVLSWAARHRWLRRALLDFRPEIPPR